jgi:predicted TIM-barrel enzyme|tara:strand:+ start:252 stop:539 length:288 start_codon:yes stop_codon:yes gene_type:complete
MAKVSEKISFEHDNMVIKQRHDVSQALRDAQVARDAGVGMSGENRLAGFLDGAVLASWLKEAGVAWSDTEAAKEVVKRKMMSGEFAKFRVWEGSY